jgi:hypothetical protein
MQINKNMLIDLCACNYSTWDVLVNSVDGTIKDYTSSTPLLWIKIIQCSYWI